MAHLDGSDGMETPVLKYVKKNIYTIWVAKVLKSVLRWSSGNRRHVFTFSV